ncbi:hypothetical protein [Roseovarius dicentrarchi]|uniref:hypothetical protein n=1 Tax=Roseovarius dicentrarchi TaxID=2250573 RepID=UPI00139666A5|nr:hypothetical protein [Roseovarius dicentrarchi]
MSPTNTLKESRKALYDSARAAFVMRGTSITEWSRDNGTRIQNVRAAFLGEWTGPKADALRLTVLDAAGLVEK